MKFNSSTLEETVNKLKAALPADLEEIKRMQEDKLKLLVENMLQKLDLVPRGEYEVQTEVLKRTRERLEQLEQRIAVLEKEQN